MNRQERRSGKWSVLNPREDYDQLEREVGQDARKVMMALLRQIAGADAPFDDRTLWNSIRELINHRLLKVYFRIGRDGVEVRHELLMPYENDNLPVQPGGHAA
jgi:hypothetical protein